MSEDVPLCPLRRPSFCWHWTYNRGHRVRTEGTKSRLSRWRSSIIGKFPDYSLPIFLKTPLRLTSVRTHRIGIPIKIAAIKIGEMRREQPSGVTITKWNSSIDYHSRKGTKLIFVGYRCSYISPIVEEGQTRRSDLVMGYRETVCKQTIIRRFLALGIVTEKRTRWCDVHCISFDEGVRKTKQTSCSTTESIGKKTEQSPTHPFSRSRE